MGRRKGSINKQSKKPVEVDLTQEERLKLLADILVEMAIDEVRNEV